MANVKLLVVDDEPQILRFLRASLDPAAIELIEAQNGKEAIRLVATENPEIVLLDLGLPDIDGLDVIRAIREWSAVPIIILSARGDESDKIRALDLGADDYLTKPFSLGELQARMRVVLRRDSRSEPRESVFQAGSLVVDYESRLVRMDGREIHLTPIEYKLLTTLTKHAGKVLTQNYLLAEVWGQAYVKQNHYLRVFMGQLRHKLEHDPARPVYLVTEPGVGYRFNLPSS